MRLFWVLLLLHPIWVILKVYFTFFIVFASIIIIIYALGVMPYKYSFHGCPRKSQSLVKVCDSIFYVLQWPILVSHYTSTRIQSRFTIKKNYFDLVRITNRKCSRQSCSLLMISSFSFHYVLQKTTWNKTQTIY